MAGKSWVGRRWGSAWLLTRYSLYDPENMKQIAFLFSHIVRSSVDLRENSDSVGGIFSYLMCAKFDRSCPANVFVDGNAGLRLGWSWTERRLRRTPTGGRGATEDC